MSTDTHTDALHLVTVDFQMVQTAKGNEVAHHPGCRHVKAAQAKGLKVYEPSTTIARDLWGGPSYRDYPKSSEVADCLYERLVNAVMTYKP